MRGYTVFAAWKGALPNLSSGFYAVLMKTFRWKEARASPLTIHTLTQAAVEYRVA